MTAKSFIRKLAEATNSESDYDLERETGVEHTNISKMRNGHRKDINLTTLARIAGRTGIGIGTLAEWWTEGEIEPHASPRTSNSLTDLASLIVKRKDLK